MALSRRDLLKVSSIGVAAAALGGCAASEGTGTPKEASVSKPKKLLMGAPKGNRVVIIGAGFAGLTVAKYIRKHNANSEVVLLDRKDNFVSCPISNEWLVGLTQIDKLSFGYYEVAKKHGYKFLHATVSGIDRGARMVSTEKGDIGYDYLVLASGISYDYSKYFGSDTALAERCRQECPPALMFGSEHFALKKKIESFEEGNFIISIPDGVYRCPPAPYERAAMIAWHIKKNKLNGKVIILDPKAKPAPKGAGFLAAYKELYPNIIEYHPHTAVSKIDLDKKTITTESTKDEKGGSKTFSFEEANIIPPNVASPLIKEAGVGMGAAGWGQVVSPTFRTKADERVFVVGDAVGGYPYPKSGAIANAEGKILAKSIANILAGKSDDSLGTLPENVCYSIVNGDPQEAISIGVSYQLVKQKDDKGNESLNIKPTSKENNTRSKDAGVATHEWFKGIMNDLFS